MSRRLARRHHGWQQSVAVALVLFGMFCGLALVLAGSEPRRVEHSGVSSAVAARAQRAAAAGARAISALNANNYGEMKRHLEQVRQELARLIKQIEGGDADASSSGASAKHEAEQE